VAKDPLDYLEDARIKGRAITGSDMRKNIGSKAEQDKTLTRQRKKLKPPTADEEIMESQSKLRRIFSK
jgi:hypothetical protein